MIATLPFKSIFDFKNNLVSLLLKFLGFNCDQNWCLTDSLVMTSTTISSGKSFLSQVLTN